VADWLEEGLAFDVVLHHGDADQLHALSLQLADRPGAIVSLHGHGRGEDAMALERLLIERAVSLNTAAAGGNASLMTIG